MGNRYFLQGKQYWFLYKFSLLFKDMTFYRKTQNTKRPYLYWKGQSKQNLLHLKCAPQNIKEFRKGGRTQQGQKTGTDTAQAERSDGRSSLSTIPVLSFPPPASSQGLVAVRIKKVFPPTCGGFSTTQNIVDNSAPLFILTLFPLPFLLGTRLLPVFPTQCPQHTNHVTLRGPLDCRLIELKKPARGAYAAAPSLWRTPKPRLGEKQGGQPLT